MEIYNLQDIELMKHNIDNILDKVQGKRLKIFEPTKNEYLAVMESILDFIKKNKRKIYGGYAVNTLLKHKDSKDAIYTELHLPDIDFYSPEPIKDIILLCNILYDKGFKRIVGKTAVHKETYSVFVNLNLYCDISYVPKNIYNRIPMKEIDNLRFVHPFFMMIDYFRMFTDPLVSFHRLEKTFKRYYLLQKHYPLPYINKVVPIPESDRHKNKIDKLLSVIFTFLKNRPTIIMFGLYNYNYFLYNSGVLNSKDRKYKNFKLIGVSYYEFMSTSFKKDGIVLIAKLKETYPELADKINITEYYPFFQFYGHNAIITYDGIPIAHIYHYYNRCIPYKKVPAILFTKISATNDYILIGTFSFTILMYMIFVIKSRINDDRVMINMYYTLLSHLIQIRQFYLEKNKKNIFDDTLFQDFVIECLGETITPEREKRLRVEYKKEKGKPYLFQYEPEVSKKEEIPEYIFSNSSGNIVRNPKNLKLTEAKSEEIIIS